MNVKSNSMAKLRKVSLIFGIILLLGPMLAVPGFFDAKLDMINFSYKVLTVLQLFVSLIFLFSAYKLKDVTKKNIQLFKYACALGIVYVTAFSVVFILQSYEDLGVSFISGVSYLMMATILGGSFVWCLQTARNINKVWI